MYQIEQTSYGIKLTFGGFMRAEEMAKWVDESKKVLKEVEGPFGVFVDMRSLRPLPADAQQEMKEGQKLYKERGMQRSVVILDNSITTMQFKRIAQETGIYDWERYIDASSDGNWEQTGLDWIVKGVDPDA